VDIDFTVLLTHIGFDEDKQLAALLDPDWGVDVIIGGHSHTILQEPERVNDILIVQAGVGTLQVGRFDIVVDTDLNTFESYEWQLIPINSQNCPSDLQLEEAIARFKQQIDEKYERVLCRFLRPLTHPDRNRETELGNLICDALKEHLGMDLMLVGSGSLRKEVVGPLLTHANLMEFMPYDDRILLLKINGAQLRRMLSFMLRDEHLNGGHGEFYQFSEGLNVTYNRAGRCFERFEFDGKPLEDEDVLSVGLQEYHYKNFETVFNMPLSEIKDGKGKVICTSLRDVLEEYFTETHNPDARVEGRLVIV
jgi:5'-nucleotidase